MKRGILALVLCLLLVISVPAFASNYYLIEDSNTRRLTEDELWEWQYDALGYVLNEIYARHGYHFSSGSKYAQYFVTQEWYRERPQNVNNDDILKELSPVEQYNERLIRRVRSNMLEEGTENDEGRELGPIAYSSEKSGMEFLLTDVESYRVMIVYSGPGTQYYRGADGRAICSTNGEVWVCGWDGDWLLIIYETNKGPSRVGYVNKKYIDNRNRLEIPDVSFEYRDAAMRTDCEFTDDPWNEINMIGMLRADQPVVYLGSYIHEGRNWAYVEANVDREPARGFVPAELIEITGKAADETEKAEETEQNVNQISEAESDMDEYEDVFEDEYENAFGDEYEDASEEAYGDAFEDEYDDAFEDEHDDAFEDEHDDAFEDEYNEFEDGYDDAFEDEYDNASEFGFEDIFEELLGDIFRSEPDEASGDEPNGDNAQDME